MIQNRIEKNYKKLENWARQGNIEAFRIYDHDIPEFPFFIDRYRNKYVVYDRTDTRDIDKNQLPQVIVALKTIFNCEDADIVIKKRERQKGDQQYTRLNQTDHFMWVQEGEAQLRVNLQDYLDTGLFLDHRPLRNKIFKNAHGKKFLNLFCYTGSVSVFAALGGAETTSVDMSATYLDWAIENFKGNQINLTDPKKPHYFIEENALDYLDRRQTDLFDIIFLDPPTFSNSKKMVGTFDVERDQDFLVEKCMERLKPQGTLYFSNNKQKFRLSRTVQSLFNTKDITASTIPRDFHDQKVHQCFEITSKF